MSHNESSSYGSFAAFWKVLERSTFSVKFPVFHNPNDHVIDFAANESLAYAILMTHHTYDSLIS